MNYLIVAGDDVIGIMEDPGADPPMGMVTGRFTSFPAYERVRPVFRMYAQVKLDDNPETAEAQYNPFYRERDALNLSVRTRDNLPVPVSWVHIYDFVQELGEEEGFEAEFNVPPNSVFEPTGSFFDDKRYWDGFDYWAQPKPQEGTSS